MGTAFVGAVVAMGSAAAQSKAAKSAANTQAGALYQSAETVQKAADRARSDVISNLDPAMQDYAKQLQNSRDLLIRGDTDVMSILKQSTNAADSILAQSGADVQKLILGASASSRGVPREMFERQYSTGQLPGQTAPPTGQPLPQGQQAPPMAGIGGQARLPETAITPVLNNYGAGVSPEAPGTPTTQGATPGAGVFEAVPLTGVSGIGGDLIQAPEQAPVAGVAGTGYFQARDDLAGARDISRAGIEAGRTGALGQLARGEGILTDAEGRALERTSTFSDAGREAAGREAALSGALGPEAQQAAMDEFMESPGQKFLRERQEKALLRSQAATGGLGGGRVLTALQEQAMGIAATQQQQQLANLGTIAQRGAGLAQGEQSLIGQMGAGRAGFAGQAAGVETGAAKDLAQIESIYGPQLAQYAMQTGMQLADVQRMTDQQRAGLVQGLGSGLAGVRAGTIGDISGLSQNLGTTGLNQANVMAQLLANIGTGAGSQIAGYGAQAGATQAAGTMAAGNALAKGIGGLGSAANYGLGQMGGFSGFGGGGGGLPSSNFQGAAPITNPYTGGIQGGM